MSEGDLDALELNRRMVAELRRRGSATTDRVISAFRAAPRHEFLPGTPLAEAYSAAEAVPIRRDAHGMSTSSSSAPSIMGPMLEQLELSAGAEVLEVGTGRGYNAALFDAPEFSAGLESLLRIAPTTETATEAPPGWFERAALDESDLLPISMFEEGSWNDRRGFFDPHGGSIAVVAGTEMSVYGSPLAAATLRRRMERAQPLDLSTLEIVAVPTPEGSRSQASWRIIRPCFTFLLRER